MCAAVLPHADPLHKVTILPMGMALGVTQQLPAEDRHSYDQHYLEDRLCIAMGGRMAEDIVFDVMSTGGSNDLVTSTELARKMVREWGMSERIGPMAWGSQGAVFLGDDLMHTRDYSDETARVIDEEVERILREQEERCRALLEEHRNGLDLVARSLLEHETIDGAEVERLVELGRKGTRAADLFGEREPANGAGGDPTDRPTATTGRSQASPTDSSVRRAAVVAVERQLAGSRSSASLAQRSAAGGGPRKLARTTPSASATSTSGTESIAVALVEVAARLEADVLDGDLARLEQRRPSPTCRRTTGTTSS